MKRQTPFWTRQKQRLSLRRRRCCRKLTQRLKIWTATTKIVTRKDNAENDKALYDEFLSKAK